MTKKQKSEAERISRIPDSSPVLIILYLLGLYGMISTAAGFLELTDNPAYHIILIGIEVFSLILWYIYIHQNKYFLYLVLGLCALTVLFIIPSWDSIINSFSSIQRISGGISFVAPILIFTIALLLFYLEFVIRRHSILFLLCLGLVVLGPIAGMSMNPVSIVLIVIFQFGFYVFNTNISLRRSRLEVSNNRRITALSTTVTAVLLLIAFIPSFIAQHLFEDDLYMQVYMADAYLQDTINNALGNFSTNVVDGSVSRGNLRQSGKPVFQIDVRDQPANRLYLRGFIGSVYNGTGWTNAYQPYNVVFDYANTYGDTRSDRRYDTFYRETAAEPITDQIQQQFCSDYLSALSQQVGIELKTLQTGASNTSEFIYCYDESGREVAVQSGLFYDLPMINDSTMSRTSTSPVAYIFKPGVRINLSGERLERAISDYNSSSEDPDADLLIENSILLNASELPAFPVLMDQTSHSEILSDIYAVFGLKGILFDKETGMLTTEHMSSNQPTNDYRISPVNGNSQTVLYPYNPSLHQAIGIFGDSEGSINQPYAASYYFDDRISMQDKWTDIPYYEQYVQQYEKIIDSTYCTYDASKFPRLEALCREARSEVDTTHINEVTTFILYTLQNNARYSKTPGTVPFHSETVEYFLFDNHQGYCVHFATAAAMMYRMFGIPCRYVSGYAVSPGSFQPQDSVLTDDLQSQYHFQSSVSDTSAHAWVEIFLKDYGWVPVEVTPTLDGVMRASYPGYNDTVMRNIMKEKGWKFKPRNADGTPIGEAALRNGQQVNLIRVLTTGLAAALILLAVGIVIRRIIILRQQKTMGCRRAFDRFIRLMHYGGILPDRNGSERSFTAELCNAMPFIDYADADKMIAILQADNYSENRASEEDSAFVRQLYFKTVPTIYQSLPWYKKIIFKLLHCFS